MVSSLCFQIHNLYRYNTGTTALFYNWRREAPRALEHAKSKGADAFYMAELEGSLLPGESREVMWTFKSAEPGMFLDKWQLETKPALREGPAPPVVLKGVATSEDANSYPRRMLAAELAHKEMVHKVTTAVGRVFQRVSTPEPFARAPEAPSGPDAARWAAANHGRRPRVYYSEEVCATLRNVHADALAAFKVLAPPPAEGEEAGEKDGAAPAAGEEGYVPPVAMESEEWDGSVAAVEAQLDALEAAIAASPDWTPPEQEPVAEAEAEEGAEPVAPVPVPPTPSEVLQRCRADAAAAAVTAALPETRAGILANAVSEALASALDGMDAAAAEAMAAHGPPKPPTPEPTSAEGVECEGEGAAAAEAPAEGDAAPAEGDAAAASAESAEAVDVSLREAYLAALSEKVAEMLGAAVDDFERNRVAEADAEVNAECERRAAGNEEGTGGGEQGEWDVYAMLRRRKALLGCEP
jgi:hypothetical protein